MRSPTQDDEAPRHVLNGDGMRPSFEAAGIPGAFVVWREAAIDGPVAADMSSAAIREARAQWIASSEVDPREYAEDFDRREQFLAACEDGELVLWFEADSFCEVHLLDLLGRTSERPELRVDVVHPPTLSLSPERLRERFEARETASLAGRREARDAWRRYCDADPREFVGMTSADPLLGPILSALQRDFIGRFGDRRGLSRFDELVLAQLGERSESPAALFRLTREEPELARLGLGDLQVWSRLEDLATRGLLTLARPLAIDTQEPTIAATELGRAALAGERPAPPPTGPIAGADPRRWVREGDRLLEAG